MRKARVLALVGIVTLAAVGFGVLAIAWLDNSDNSEADIVVDDHVAREWEQALAPGLHDLNNLGALPGLASEGAAERDRCSIDSGQLLDLSAGRSWKARMPGGSVESGHASVSARSAEGFHELIHRLTAAGWVVTYRGTDRGMRLPRNLTFDTVGLSKRTGRGTTLLLTGQAADDGVWTILDFAGSKRACHLAG